MDIENKSISILGCGWLGVPLAKHLIQKGFSVKGSVTS
jgi:3-hydroxyisobutyrate dehydrogenase-like beta-hydroxyacid dehydrogenase